MLHVSLKGSTWGEGWVPHPPITQGWGTYVTARPRKASLQLQARASTSPTRSRQKRWPFFSSRRSMNTILRRTMSRFTIANLPRMEVTALSQQLLALKSPDNSLAVIDVRDGGT